VSPEGVNKAVEPANESQKTSTPKPEVQMKWSATRAYWYRTWKTGNGLTTYATNARKSAPPKVMHCQQFQAF
jgi:hypothetical protein